MAGILWLASYPKSGNTWLRMFLANLLQNPDRPVDINALASGQFGDMDPRAYEIAAGRPIAGMSDVELHRLRPVVHRAMATNRNEMAIVKTHNAMAQREGIPFVTPEVTQGAIYVIRNPMDVTVSFSHHYGLSLDDTIEALASTAHQIRTNDRGVFQYLGTWSEHAKSWVEANGLNLLTLRYEDMHSNPMKTFGRAVSYLGLPRDPARLKRAIKFSSFSEAASQEKQKGFAERSRSADRFFRSGKAGTWRGHLSDEQVTRIRATHEEMMIEFGYIKPNGRLAI